jgi:hypothetical protein
MHVFYLLVEGLLNNSISSSDYVVSNGRTIRKLIGKGVVGNCRSVIWGPILDLSGENQKNSSKLKLPELNTKKGC